MYIILMRSPKDLVGEVLLSLKFLPTSQRLEVGLLKVKTVLSEISPNAGKLKKDTFTQKRRQL